MTRLASLLGLAAVLALATPQGAQAIEPHDPVFATPCDYSHTAPDDPIVAPGRAGASHNHDFFGNLGTDAFSTYDSLRAEGTACRREADTAAYWVPSLSQNGTTLEPRRAQIYYQGGRTDRTAVRAHPANLRVIAGDARATEPQSKAVISWNCGSRSGVPSQTEPPLCPEGHWLRLRVGFPNCWNGRDLDVPDHASHMAYSRRGACPASHPVALPMVVFNVEYPTRGGDGILLASGRHFTAHADFLNSWDQAELERLVSTCINQTGKADSAACKPQGARVPSIVAAPLVTTYGRSVVFGGAIGGRAGERVGIEIHRGGEWIRVAEVSTARRGVYFARVRPARNSRYRAIVPRTGRRSRAVNVLVRPSISLRVRSARRALRVAARSTPMKRRLVIRVERRVGRSYRLVRRAIVRTRRGRAAATLRVPRRGRHRVVVRTAADSRNDAGTSRAAYRFVR